MCTPDCVFLPGFSIFVWPLTGRENVSHCRFTGTSLFAETLQKRVLANVRMHMAGLVLILKKMVILFPYLQGRQYEYDKNG